MLTQYNWHTVCLAVFLLITCCDFVVMPIWTEYYNDQLTPEKMVDLATKFDGAASQIAALQTLRSERVWQPLTLSQSGMFFVAFGAILGVGAWTRTKSDLDVIRINEKRKNEAPTP